MADICAYCGKATWKTTKFVTAVGRVEAYHPRCYDKRFPTLIHQQKAAPAQTAPVWEGYKQVDTYGPGFLITAGTVLFVGVLLVVANTLRERPVYTEEVAPKAPAVYHAVQAPVLAPTAPPYAALPEVSTAPALPEAPTPLAEVPAMPAPVAKRAVVRVRAPVVTAPTTAVPAHSVSMPSFAPPEVGEEVLVQSGGVTDADVYRLLHSDKTTTELKRQLGDLDIHVRCDLDKAVFFNATRTVMYLHPCTGADEHFCKTFCAKTRVDTATICSALGTARRLVLAAETIDFARAAIPDTTSSSVRAGGQALHWAGTHGCLSIFFEVESGGSGDLRAVKALCTKQCAPSKFYTESNGGAP